MKPGIYTFANDVVYDQLVALLNSIEANAGHEIPVCVIPYNDQITQVSAEIKSRKNVTLFDDQNSIDFWENFAAEAWQSHPQAQAGWKNNTYQVVRHRKLCCFDGPFEQFIYFDADTLMLGSVDQIYEKLANYDWITYDFQYRSDLKYIFDPSQPNLRQVFTENDLKSKIFCSGWFASKKGVFPSEMLTELLVKLKNGESQLMAFRGDASDQSLLNYLVLRSGISYYNFAYHGVESATGNHWSSEFEEIEHRLYDRGTPLTYLHYMSISSQEFQKLCGGENVGIPYQDLFLYYRYLGMPGSPPLLKSASQWVKFQRQFKKWCRQKVKNLQRKLTTKN